MVATDRLPPLREVIRRHGIAAKKSLGQHFLLDLNLTDRIARAAGDLSQTTVVEIGPGPGGLTRSLLSVGATKVIAVERDARCLAALGEIESQWPGQLEVVAGDALKMPLNELSGPPTKIVANLPYNIATKLLVNWLTESEWPPHWQSMTLMFQREVGQRITATAGDNAYGRLSVLTGWRCEALTLFDIDPSAFIPPPKVISTLIQITPRTAPLECDPAVLGRVTAAAFGQRRKMLRQSLRSLGGDPGDLLRAAGIEGSRRAEEIPVAGFVALANAYRATLA